MKTLSAALAAHMAGASTTLAQLWKVTRADGVVLGFTDHDRPIAFNDGSGSPPGTTVTYMPQQGATGSAIQSASDLSTANQELVGFLEADAITEADILANRYDYAVIEVRLVNWADLTQGALMLKKATLGEVKLKNGQFTAELRGLEFFLSTNIGETFGPTCRADLGDSRCGIDLSLWRQSGYASTVSDLRTFVPVSSSLGSLTMRGSATPDAPAPANWFREGILTWTSGLNTGLEIEIAAWDGTTLVLFENMPYAIEPGDTFTIEPGCNHLSGGSGDCQSKFVNIANFRGEPRIPGMQQILMYPNSDGSVPT